MLAQAICVGYEDSEGLWFATMLGEGSSFRRMVTKNLIWCSDPHRALDVAKIASRAREERPDVYIAIDSIGKFTAHELKNDYG